MRVEILETLALQLDLSLENLLFCPREYAVKPAQHGERKDDVLVFSAFECVANEVRDPPEEADDLTMVHRLCSPF